MTGEVQSLPLVFGLSQLLPSLCTGPQKLWRTPQTYSRGLGSSVVSLDKIQYGCEATQKSDLRHCKYASEQRERKVPLSLSVSSRATLASSRCLSLLPTLSEVRARILDILGVPNEETYVCTCDVSKGQTVGEVFLFPSFASFPFLFLLRYLDFFLILSLLCLSLGL